MSRPSSRPARRPLFLAVALPSVLFAAALAACGPVPTEAAAPRHQAPAVHDGAPGDSTHRSGGGSTNPNI